MHLHQLKTSGKSTLEGATLPEHPPGFRMPPGDIQKETKCPADEFCAGEHTRVLASWQMNNC
jgi:hypothetical protein